MKKARENSFDWDNAFTWAALIIAWATVIFALAIGD
jgi:hypothetical protein